MSEADEVRNASNHFYVALNRMLSGDAGPLADIVVSYTNPRWFV